jgi:endonuclease III
MPRERKADRIERAARIFELLEEAYPDAHCALHHRNPFELTVATILSAQCTDARVNQVTPALFEAFPDAESLAGARLDEVEELIHSTGFFRNKAKNLVGMATAVVERHGGEIPRTLDELVKLPGVGRKTANVVLGNAFGIDEGIVVDTHVKRLAKRLGFTRQSDPVRVEADLVKLFPRSRWTLLSHLLIFHGREVCGARKPRCPVCPVAHLCPSASVSVSSPPQDQS